MPGVVLKRRKTHGLHSIDVKSAMQMIDLVLKNASIPSGGVNDPRLSAMIEAMHANFSCSRDQRGKAGQTKAAFKEGLGWLGEKLEGRIHNHMKRNRASLALLQLFFGE